MAEFINPRADWAFKRIFGSEDTKECLITFLNGLFEGEFVIRDVKFVNTEQIRHNEDERGVVFDVKCITEDGRHIIVEMQKKEQKYFVDRAIFYTSKAIVEQGVRSSPWDFHLAPVYTVCFMDFKVKTGIPHQFRTDIGLGLLEDVKEKTTEGKTYELSGLKFGFEKMRLTFLQLPLFEKRQASECEDDLFDCWIYIIKNMEKLKEMPFVDKYPVFRMLAEIGDLRKLSPEERELYDEDIKVMRDLYATQKWEEEQKRMEIEKGRAEGREQGRAEGREQGRAEGREQGRAEGKLEIAKNLLAMGIPMDKVVQASGLTEEQISAMMN